MRMLAGASIAEDSAAGQADIDWSQSVAGPWLAQTLAGLRGPEGLARVDPGRALRGTLRPYQQAGVQWLYLLAKLKLGACLADDMGLGKTIQVLSLLLALKNETSGQGKPCLLVAPASLLANWTAEITRFAPGLRALVAHPSAMPARGKADETRDLSDIDLVITSDG
jgi:non-specific serine/threonine protein kinase